MAGASKKGEDESELSEVIDKLKVGAKVAAYGGLTAVSLAAKAVSAGAKAVNKAASNAKRDLMK